MKTIFSLSALAVISAALIGCAGSSKPQQDTPSSMTASTPSRVPQVIVDYDIIDYQGLSLGREPPRWVDLVASQEKSELKKMPEFSDKEIYVYNPEGADLDMIRTSAQIQAFEEISTQIKTAINVEAGRVIRGDPGDVATKKQYIDSIAGIVSESVVSGFVRDRDFWQKIQYRKDSSKSGQQAIKYYALYTIGAEELKLQLDRALGKADAKTQSEREAREDIRSAIRSAKNLLDTER
jgi:hypothetical protein